MAYPGRVICSHRDRRGGSSNHGLELIRLPLSPLSYAPVGRAGGIRTHTCRIKSPVCCQLHHNPVRRSGVSVNRRRCNMRLLLRQSVQVVAPRIELGATRLSAVSGQPALDYHRSRAPRSRTNMENLLLPKQACCHLHLCPCVDQIVSQNGRIRTCDLLAPDQARCPGFATFCSSGLGGARILVSGSSDRC